MCSTGWSLVTKGFPTSSVEEWSKWIDVLYSIHGAGWRSHGIHGFIMVSRGAITPKPVLLSAAMVFWDNTNNTFNFRMGPMTFIMLDLAWPYGLGPFISFKVIDLKCFPEGLGLITSVLGFLSRENAWAAG